MKFYTFIFTILHSRQWFNTLVDSQSCGPDCPPLVVHAWLHWWAIDRLSCCRQYSWHRQYMCQRAITVALRSCMVLVVN